MERKIELPSDMCGIDTLINLRDLLEERATKQAKKVFKVAECIGRGSMNTMLDYVEETDSFVQHPDGQDAGGMLEYYVEELAKTYHDAGWVKAQLESRGWVTKQRGKNAEV